MFAFLKEYIENNSVEDFNRYFSINGGILANINDGNGTLLHAIFSTDTFYPRFNEIIKCLLYTGCDPNAWRNYNNRETALHCLIRWRSDERYENRQALETLLFNGADPELKDSSNLTPLELCFISERKSYINTLLRYNVNVNALDRKGFSLLNMSPYYESYSPSDVSTLIGEFYMDLELKNEHNLTPLEHAIYYKDAKMIQALLCYDVTININSYKLYFKSLQHFMTHGHFNNNAKFILTLLIYNLFKRVPNFYMVFKRMRENTIYCNWQQLQQYIFEVGLLKATPIAMIGVPIGLANFTFYQFLMIDFVKDDLYKMKPVMKMVRAQKHIYYNKFPLFGRIIEYKTQLLKNRLKDYDQFKLLYMNTYSRYYTAMLLQPEFQCVFDRIMKSYLMFTLKYHTISTITFY